MDYQELIKQLRDTNRHTFALWFEAADAIESLLAENERLNAELAKYRDGRLAAREYVAVLESRLQEIGDLAASCRTGPALREALAQIEAMTDIRHNAELCGVRRTSERADG